MEQQREDEKWMRRCIALAKGGLYGAPPNPLVGAVAVARGRVIGEGYHARCGQAHAEVNAIASVRPADRPLLREATLYVSLEPCAHYGRTPPCAERIASEGIPRVVAGCRDPFARVAGRGFDILRRAGVSVTEGVLEAECRELNRRFFTVQELRRPFVVLKWARSADGFLDLARSGGSPARLSTPLSRLCGHRLRSLCGAVAVGRRTLLLDRPRLDTRHWAGPSPLRCVLGRPAAGELPEGFEAFPSTGALFAALMERGVTSLLVEGGAATLQGFLDAGRWDEAWEETAACRLGAGVPAPAVPPGAERRDMTRFGACFSRYRNLSPAP